MSRIFLTLCLTVILIPVGLCAVLPNYRSATYGEETFDGDIDVTDRTRFGSGSYGSAPLQGTSGYVTLVPTVEVLDDKADGKEEEEEEDADPVDNLDSESRVGSASDIQAADNDENEKVNDSLIDIQVDIDDTVKPSQERLAVLKAIDRLASVAELLGVSADISSENGNEDIDDDIPPAKNLGIGSVHIDIIEKKNTEGISTIEAEDEGISHANVARELILSVKKSLREKSEGPASTNDDTVDGSIDDEGDE